MGKMAERLKQKRLAKQQNRVSKGKSDPREEALLLEASNARKTNDLDTVFDCYRQILAINPRNMAAHYNLGVLYFHYRKPEPAEHHLSIAARAGKDDFPQLDKFLGLTAYSRGNYARAAAFFEAFNDEHPDLLIQGLILESWNKSFAFKKVIAFLEGKDISEWTDEFFDAYLDACIAVNERQKGFEIIQQGVDRDPDNIQRLNMLAKAYAALKQFGEAFRIYDMLYSKYPGSMSVALNYALALSENQQLQKAEDLFDTILEKTPSNFEAYMNKAYLMRKQHRLDEAVECVRQALEIDPVSPLANYTYGILNVQNENYREGYPYHEWSWHVADMEKFRPQGDLPDWHGEDINDKALLLYTDQGIGDTIVHIRYVDRIFAMYPQCRVIIVCEEKTVELYQNAFESERMTVYAKSDSLQGVKAQFKAAFCSLPYLLKETIHTVPANVPYLKAKKTLSYKQADSDIVVGITWHTKSHSAGHLRSLDLAQFAPLAALPGVRVLNLQYGDTKEARETCGFDIIHDPDIDPWEDMQGHIDQIAACDLVVTVDNTTAHAAGALGKPVWTVLPYDSYWRCWHVGCEATPWYPTMRLFRQDKSRDYAPVLDRIVRDAGKLAKGDRSVLEAPAFQPSRPPVSQEKPKALLLNDTYNWYHWGCTATSGAIRDQLAGKGYEVVSAHYLEGVKTSVPLPALTDFDDAAYFDQCRFNNPTLFWKIEQADIVVINGEGTIHGTNNALRLLYLAYKAAAFFKKPVYIINHACFPEDGRSLSDPQTIAFYLKAYKEAAGVAVRDPISRDILQSLRIDAVPAFDSLPLTARSWLSESRTGPVERRKRVVLGGSSKFSGAGKAAYKKIIEDLLADGYEITMLTGARHNKTSDDNQMLDMLTKLVGENKIAFFEARSLDEWFDHLRSASLLISGRFHYTIAAACMGTPSVVFEGNTPKIHALADFLQSPPPLHYDSPDLTAELTLAVTKALKAGPMPEAARGALVDKMCAMAMRNYAFIPSVSE